MSIKVQEAPQAPSYAAAHIQVRSDIASPHATMEGVKAQQGQLNAVNNLSGGRHRRSTKKQHRSEYKHKSFIRTYKGRRYQQGGSGDRIPVPQVGTACSSGPQCMGVQNASLTALNNQAMSNSINDAYVKSGGRRGHKKVRFSHRTRHLKTKQRREYSLTSTIAYNIKKVMRKVFD
jgi:hypothetical protein